jgi:hypothetical protein
MAPLGEDAEDAWIMTIIMTTFPVFDLHMLERPSSVHVL